MSETAVCAGSGAASSRNCYGCYGHNLNSVYIFSVSSTLFTTVIINKLLP